jgi:hypothetical protein
MVSTAASDRTFVIKVSTPFPQTVHCKLHWHGFKYLADLARTCVVNSVFSLLSCVVLLFRLSFDRFYCLCCMA